MSEKQAVWSEKSSQSGIVTVWIDCPDKKVNTLSLELMPAFERVFDEIGQDSSVRAVVIASAKQSGFIAGADIDDLDEVDTASKGSVVLS